MFDNLIWQYYIGRFFESNILVYPYIPDSVGYLDLRDHVFIVTGANSPIGSCVAKFLNDRGAMVIRVSRSSEYVNEHEYLCDLSDPRQVLELCDKVKAKYTKINRIVNMASGLYETYETNLE